MKTLSPPPPASTSIDVNAFFANVRLKPSSSVTVITAELADSRTSSTSASDRT
jgi:hypothetical protein